MQVKKYSSFKYGQFEKALDEYLGTERYGNDIDTLKDYNDPRVCKYSLAGCCPFHLLEETRMSKGPCKYEICPCPSSLRDQYLNENRGYTTTYDQALFDFLDGIIADAERRIGISKAFQQSKSSDLQTSPELIELDRKIAELIRRSRENGENGYVSRALSQYNEAEMYMKQRAEKENQLMKNTAEKDQKIHICEVCTAVIQNSDQDGRMANHNCGRQHVAYLKMREVYETLKSNGIVSSRRKPRGPIPQGNFREAISPMPVRRLVPLE